MISDHAAVRVMVSTIELALLLTGIVVDASIRLGRIRWGAREAKVAFPFIAAVPIAGAVFLFIDVRGALLFTSLIAVPITLIVEGLFGARERTRPLMPILALCAGFVIAASFDPSRFTWLTAMLAALAALLVTIGTLLYAFLPRWDEAKAAGFGRFVLSLALAIPLVLSHASIQFWFFAGLAAPELAKSFWMLVSPATEEQKVASRPHPAFLVIVVASGSATLLALSNGIAFSWLVNGIVLLPIVGRFVHERI